MQTMKYSEANKNLSAAMQKAEDNCTHIMITRSTGCNVVMMTEADYSAEEETRYLLSTPANHAHLMRAIRDVEAGRVVTMDLID